MRFRFAALFAIILAAFALINYYIGWHLKLFLSETFGMQAGVAYWLPFWLVAFSYIVSRLAARLLPGPIARLLKRIGSYWFAVVLYGALLLPVVDVAAWLLRLADIGRGEYVVTLGCAFGLALLAVLLRGSRNAWSPVVRKYDVTIAKPAGGRQTWRIAVASDLHLGAIVGNRHLERLVARINAMEPDLILLPGDIIDDDIEPFVRMNMADRFAKLRSRLGAYAVLGNHEYFGGHIEEFVRRMEEAGVKVLRDERVIVDGCVTVAGRKDRTAEQLLPGGGGGRLHLDELLEGADKSMPLILMDHQPHKLGAAADAGVDVLLSGHTHRGQMAPNHWITGRLFELDWGYLRKGAMHAIVSSGFGTWGPPIRLGSRSELIELTVRFASPE